MSSSSVKLELSFRRLLGDVCWTTSWCRVNIRLTLGVDSSDGSNEFVLKDNLHLWDQIQWLEFYFDESLKWELDRLPFGEVFFKTKWKKYFNDEITTHMFSIWMFIRWCMTSCSWRNCWLIFLKSIMIIIFIHFIITRIPTNTKESSSKRKSKEKSLNFTLMLLEDFQLNVSFVVKHSTKEKNDFHWWNMKMKIKYLNIILIDSSTSIEWFFIIRCFWWCVRWWRRNTTNWTTSDLTSRLFTWTIRW